MSCEQKGVIIGTLAVVGLTPLFSGCGSTVKNAEAAGSVDHKPYQLKLGQDRRSIDVIYQDAKPLTDFSPEAWKARREATLKTALDEIEGPCKIVEVLGRKNPVRPITVVLIEDQNCTKEIPGIKLPWQLQLGQVAGRFLPWMKNP